MFACLRQLPLLLCLLISYQTHAQGNYKFASQIDSVFQRDTTARRFQQAANYYSFIGEYRQALYAFDKQPGNLPTPAPKQSQIDLFTSYHPVDAKKYLLEQASKTRILIINERHFQPQHRIFLSSLLPGLKKLGYDLMAVEALDASDSLLNERKYPVLKSGYYTQETCFGNLLRSALHKGMIIYPYDVSEPQWMKREKKQAENIDAILSKNPKSKLIIYCGLDHALEDSMHMAGILKQMTGIDPYTVDQVLLSERSQSEMDNSYRKLVNLDYPAIFVDSNGYAFNRANKSKHFDCNLYLQNSHYIDGREAWLLDKKSRLKNIRERISI